MGPPSGYLLFNYAPCARTVPITAVCRRRPESSPVLAVTDISVDQAGPRWAVCSSPAGGASGRSAGAVWWCSRGGRPRTWPVALVRHDASRPAQLPARWQRLQGVTSDLTRPAPRRTAGAASICPRNNTVRGAGGAGRRQGISGRRRRRPRPENNLAQGGGPPTGAFSKGMQWRGADSHYVSR